MDFSQEFLIDLALNTAGYLASGFLAIIIYSMFNRSKRIASSGVEDVSSDTANVNGGELETGDGCQIEFIKLGKQSSETPANGTQRPSVGGGYENDRRNRSDIIRIARSMLKAGATHDRIMRVLPVSEAELSLLGMNNS